VEAGYQAWSSSSDTAFADIRINDRIDAQYRYLVSRDWRAKFPNIIPDFRLSSEFQIFEEQVACVVTAKLTVT